jgi:glycosyltransferase involved in cell wall biosynthesis
MSSLRVAIVATSLRLAGAEKQTYYMARALHQAGIDVAFVHAGGGGHYETELTRAGVPVAKIFTANRPWLMLAKIFGVMRRFQPHVVMAAQFGDLCYAAVAGRLCGALTLGGVRSNGVYELDAHGRASRWMIRLAHGLIANSNHARKNLVSRGITPEKIEVLPNVIDLQLFDQRCALAPDFSPPAGRIIATALGSLLECKRFDRFLEALAQAKVRVPELLGVIAGKDCGARAQLEAQARKLGLGPQDVLFAGEVGNAPALLARSAFLVLTSDYEGFPNVILEAMAARLPVVSVPAGDAALIVQHGRTGYLAEASDTRGLAECMIKLAQSPELRGRFGEAGRRRVEMEFDYPLLADRLFATIQKFASRQRRHSLCELLERDGSTRSVANIPTTLMFEPPGA